MKVCFMLLIQISFLIYPIPPADSSTTDTSVWTNIHSTETSTCVQCHGNEDTTTSFITGYMSGVGTALFLVIIAAAIYHLKRRYKYIIKLYKEKRYIAKKSKPYQEGNSPTEMSTYYNENASETREQPVQLVIDANNYESLTSNSNTDKVYRELESKAEQERHSIIIWMTPNERFQGSTVYTNDCSLAPD